MARQRGSIAEAAQYMREMGDFLGLHTTLCPLQTWCDKATALQRQLTPEETWAAAVDCIEAAGDLRSSCQGQGGVQQLLQVCRKVAACCSLAVEGGSEGFRV